MPMSPTRGMNVLGVTHKLAFGRSERPASENLHRSGHAAHANRRKILRGWTIRKNPIQGLELPPCRSRATKGNVDDEFGTPQIRASRSAVAIDVQWSTLLLVARGAAAPDMA